MTNVLELMARMTRASCLLVFLALFGCSGDQLTWTEDVQLPDGSVIAVERWTEFKGGSGTPGSMTGESRQRIKFRNPRSGQIIVWENNHAEEGLLGLVALWLDEVGPNLLVTPMYSGDFLRYSCPNPPYFLFKHIRGSWIRRPLSDLKGIRIRSNLTERAREAEATIKANRHHLTARQTLNSHAYVDMKRVPYLIDFSQPYVETTGDENCDKPQNLLIGTGG